MTKTQKKVIGIAWVALMIWGLFGVMQRMIYGHLLADYGSYVPWGLWVSAKIYFIGLAEGVSFFAWVCYAFQIERFRGLVRPALWLSLVNLVVGLTIISFDLGHMWRLQEVFFRPNFFSLLTISSWISMGYLAYIAIILAMEIKPYPLATKTYRRLGWIGMGLAIIFSGGNGAEFATLISSPYWHTSLGPVLSIGDGLSSGLALILAVAAFFCFTDSSKDRETLSLLSRSVVGLLFLVIILEWSEFSVTMWYGRDRTYTVLWSILFGSYWYVFWIVHLLAGIIIPLVMLIRKPANRLNAGWAGLLIAVAHFAVRLNQVIPGQVTPAMKGLQEAYSDNRLKFVYFPSIHEWSVFAFAVALFIALFYLGIRFLPILSTKSVNEGGN